MTIETIDMTKLAAEPQSFATFAKGCILVVVKSTAASIAVLISSKARIIPRAIKIMAHSDNLI